MLLKAALPGSIREAKPACFDDHGQSACGGTRYLSRYIQHCFQTRNDGSQIQIMGVKAMMIEEELECGNFKQVFALIFDILVVMLRFS
jgi:hypothetical protein